MKLLLTLLILIPQVVEAQALYRNPWSTNVAPPVVGQLLSVSNSAPGGTNLYKFYHGDNDQVARLRDIAGTLSASNIVANSFETVTNAWTINTDIPFGPSLVLVSGAATGGFTGLSGFPTTNRASVNLIIKATGNITFTNPASVVASDGALSRVLPAGVSYLSYVSVVPGISTNFLIGAIGFAMLAGDNAFSGSNYTTGTWVGAGAVRMYDGSLIVTNMTARTNDPNAGALTVYGPQIGYGWASNWAGTRLLVHDATSTRTTNTAALTSTEIGAGQTKKWYNGTFALEDNTNSALAGYKLTDSTSPMPPTNWMAFDSTGFYVTNTSGRVLRYVSNNLTNSGTMSVYGGNSSINLNTGSSIDLIPGNGFINTYKLAAMSSAQTISGYGAISTHTTGTMSSSNITAFGTVTSTNGFTSWGGGIVESNVTGNLFSYSNGVVSFTNVANSSTNLAIRSALEVGSGTETTTIYMTNTGVTQIRLGVGVKPLNAGVEVSSNIRCAYDVEVANSGQGIYGVRFLGTGRLRGMSSGWLHLTDETETMAGGITFGPGRLSTWTLATNYPALVIESTRTNKLGSPILGIRAGTNAMEFAGLRAGEIMSSNYWTGAIVSSSNGNVVASGTLTATNGFYTLVDSNGLAGTQILSPIGFFGHLGMMTTNTLTTTTATTYYTVTNWTSSESMTNRFIVNVASGFMTNLVAGFYSISYHISVLPGNSDTTEAELFANETADEDSASFHTYANPARIATLSGVMCRYLAANTGISLRIKNSANDTVTIWRAHMKAGAP